MLTLDEARGIAAGIWTGPNFRRKVLDPIMCEEIANLLVDEILKRGLDDTATPKLKELQGQNEKLKTELLNLRSVNEKAELHQKDLEHVNGNLRHELKQAQVEVANLKSEIDRLKVKPDEVV